VRLGIVRGRVVLALADPSLRGTRFLLVEPVSARRLRTGGEEAPRPCLVVADRNLGPATGQLVAFVEGAEAANPWHPGGAPVDATLSLLVEAYDYRPPETP
jgi:microcompartment protein CcmK/EutM